MVLVFSLGRGIGFAGLMWFLAENSKTEEECFLPLFISKLIPVDPLGYTL